MIVPQAHQTARLRIKAPLGSHRLDLMFYLYLQGVHASCCTMTTRSSFFAHPEGLPLREAAQRGGFTYGCFRQSESADFFWPQFPRHLIWTPGGGSCFRFR